jgi:o-succinylbenzoate---CoA ligase
VLKLDNKQVKKMSTETMPNFLKKRALLTPDRVAVYFQDETITFRELYEK